jgi:hypothetical protein
MASPETGAIPRAPGLAVEAAVERSKCRALVAWFLAAPKLPMHPPIDYAQEPAAARAARLRRIQAQVDDLLTPLSPADIAYRYYPYW